MPLDRERAVYLRERDRLIESGHLGRWVVIRGEELVGVFDSFDDAMSAGYDRFGLDEVFMARQVARTDPIIPISRRTVHVPRKP
jgi:hypothetical protein